LAATFCGPQDTTKHPTTSSAAPSVSVYIWAYFTQSYLYSAADIMLGDAFGHRVESSVENKAMKISRSKQALLKKRGRNVHSKHNKASANSNKSSFKSPLTTHEELKPAQSKPATNKQQVTCFITHRHHIGYLCYYCPGGENRLSEHVPWRFRMFGDVYVGLNADSIYLVSVIVF